MRANAPISALLALAAPALAIVVFANHLIAPATVYAHPTHTLRRTSQQTPTSAPARPSAKKHATAKPKAQSQTKLHAKAQAKTQIKPQAKAPASSQAHAKTKRRRPRRQSVEDAVPPVINRVRVPQTQATPSDFLHAAATPQPVVNVIRPMSRPPALPTIQQAAASNLILPQLYNKRGRLIVPPALKGSHEILLHQNEIADSDGLSRIRDDEDILDLRDSNLLVALPVSHSLVVNGSLPTDRRYCRPWTAHFLATMSSAYYERFHSPLQVNSAVRTVEFQQRLLRTNGNAAPAEGDTASPHLTGQAIDLAKHGLTMAQIAWLRGYLLTLVQQGKIDVEEEFKQACFHISVYRRYLPVAPRRTIASTNNATVQAANY